MLTHKFIAALSIALLTGCALSPDKSTDTELVIDEASTLKERPVAISIDDAVLDKDDLYLILLAEIAGQRGFYEIAMEAYSRAAKHTADPRIAERAAKIALYMKDREKTDAAVATWLDRDPENLTARKIAAFSALREGERKSALTHLNFLYREDKDAFENTLMEIAKVLDSEGKGAFLYEVLDALSVQHPQDASIPYVQALLAMQLQKSDQAAKKVDKVLTLRPNWDKALLIRAQLAAYKGDLETSKSILRGIMRKQPKNPQIKKILAQVLIKTGDYKGAADTFQTLLKQQPNDFEARYQLALVYLQLQQTDKAQALFEGLLENPAWADQASLYLGRIEANRGNTRKALIWLDKVQDGPLAMEAAMNAISLLVSEGRESEAVQRLNTMKARFPKQELRLILLEAEIYSKQERYQKAFDVLTQALVSQPKQKELLYTRALVAENLNRLDVLESDLKLILDQDPNDVNALNALGYSLADHTKRYEEAKKYLDKAIALQPNEAVVIDSYGWLQFRLGKYAEALTYLQRAYSRQQEGEIAAHVIETLWAMGRKQDARIFFGKALRQVPDKQELLNLRRRLKGL